MARGDNINLDTLSSLTAAYLDNDVAVSVSVI